jgi:hypothetical protein
MQEGATIAEVIRVTRHPVFEIAEGVEVGGYTIHARINVPADKYKYSHDCFRVKISKPSACASHQHEKGSQMKDGEFSFECGEELKVGDKLEILILSTASENLP